MIQRFFHLDLNRIDDRNALYLVAEIFWAAILSAAVNFNGAFAVHLGATSTEIGLLSSIPALLAVLVAIPSGRFLAARSRRKPWLLGALLIYRACFVLVAFVPWLGSKTIPVGTLVVIFLIVMTLPLTFFNVGFTAMLGDVIPENRRAAVFTARNVIANATVSIFIFLFGLWLNKVVFPLNYQILLIFGFAASMFSHFNLMKIQVPDSIPVPLTRSNKVSLKERWHAIQQTFISQPGFMHFTFNMLVYGMGMWIASPLYILYYLRSLKASDAWLGLLGTISSVSVIVGYAIWRWVMARWGEERTLKVTIVTQGLLPLLIGLSSTLTPILFIVALNGLLAAGAGLSSTNLLLKVMPEDSRPQYTALYTTIVNIGVFIGPLIGVTVADHLGLPATLIGCGILSIVGGTSFWIWPVH
jgi:MFS family permease